MKKQFMNLSGTIRLKTTGTFVRRLSVSILMAMAMLGWNSSALAQPNILRNQQVLNCFQSTTIDALDNVPLSSCASGSVTVENITGPAHGTAVAGANGKIIYTQSPATFTGRDNILYLVKCNNGAPLAIVNMNINVTQCPDNITIEGCTGSASTATWSIAELFKKETDKTTVAVADVPLVGDIDDDGTIEILAARIVNVDIPVVGDNAVEGILSDGIIVFNGSNGTVKKVIPTVTYASTFGTRALAKIDGKTYLFIAEFSTNQTSGYIYRYDLSAGTHTRFPVPYTTWSYYAPSIMVTNFTGKKDDVHLLAIDKIYDARSGALMFDLGLRNGNPWKPIGIGSGHTAYYHLYGGGAIFPAIGDMDGDGLPEIVAGNAMYKLTVANNGTITGFTQFDGPQGFPYGDGFTALADIDMDGWLDVVVTRSTPDTTIASKTPTCYTYAWTYDRTTKAVRTFGNPISSVNASDLGYGPSIPFLGDVDGEGDPEIAFSTCRLLHVYKYDKNTKSLKSLPGWPLATDDPSASTTLTLFDFDQDGVMELVYRDMTQIRVIDKNKTNKYTQPCLSRTTNEYPVVADVTGNGHANIVVFGSLANPDTVAKYPNRPDKWVPLHKGSYESNRGKLFIFDSKIPGQWAPARHVWNQWAYNAVNVNEDLSIPQFQVNPATVFSGKNCGGEKRPYNAFLQQQTTMNTDGCVIWTSPNVVWEMKPTMVAAGDSVVMTGVLKNIGSAGMGSPIYLTIYKNSVCFTPTCIIKLDSLNKLIKPQEIYPFRYVLKNVSSYGTINKLFIGINDKSGEKITAAPTYTEQYPYEPECLISERLEVKVQSSLTDFTQVVNCNKTPQDVAIDVLASKIVDCPAANTIVTMLFSNNGATAGSNGKINYTVREPDYYNANPARRRDSIHYQVSCTGGTDSYDIWMYINVMPCPDNITPVACIGEAPDFAWNIALAYNTDSLRYKANPNSPDYKHVAPEMVVYVGDLDGDGYSEMITFTSEARGDWNLPVEEYRNYVGIHVFDREGKWLRTINTKSDGTSTEIRASRDGTGVFGLVKVKKSDISPAYTQTTLRDSVGLIVVAEADLHLYAFDVMGNQVWRSTDTYGINKFANIGFADFNHDGIPEIHVGEKIFNAATGALLATATEGSSRARSFVANDLSGYQESSKYGSVDKCYAIHQMAADVLGTGDLQMVFGNEIHEVAKSASNAITGIKLAKTAPPVSSIIIEGGSSYSVSGGSFTISGTTYTMSLDGHVGVADFDLDGKLDVLISNRFTNTFPPTGSATKKYLYFYLWNPAQNTVSPALTVETTADGNGMKNVPMIGDIDGDGSPEIVVMAGMRRLIAYKYNPATNVFAEMWTQPIFDASSSTGLTMFDFNQDGAMELVYRDESDIRILDGKTKALRGIFHCGSATGTEYPVIADVDGDGHAEIIIAGNENLLMNGNAVQEAAIMVFRGGKNLWAPARSVWNQYSYNAVNVNNDLSIPKYVMNPATVFEGECKWQPAAGPVRPYNNFLVQQTMLNQKGCPLWLLPNVEWVKEPAVAVSGNSATFTGTIKNTGDANLNDPIYVTFYKNDTLVPPGSIIRLDSIKTLLLPGETYTFSFTLNGTELTGAERVYIGVNDKRGVYPYQPQCMVAKRKKVDLSMTFHDYTQVLNCYPSTKFYVQSNGLFTPCEPTDLTVNILTQPGHGTANLADVTGAIVYTQSPTKFTGRDSLKYEVFCGDTKLGTAWLHILVLACPGEVTPADCIGSLPPNVWTITQIFEEETEKTGIYAADVPLVGDIDDDGHIEILAGNFIEGGGSLAQYQSNEIIVFNGSDGTVKRRFSVPRFNPTIGTRAIGKVDGKTYLFLATDEDKLIYRYDISSPSTNTPTSFPFPVPYTADCSYRGASMLLANFTGEENAVHLFVGDKLYDAKTGALLLEMNLKAQDRPYGWGAGHPQYWFAAEDCWNVFGIFPAVGDMDHDGLPEVVAGNAIYKLNLTNKQGTSGNTYTMRQGPTGGVYGDGFTALADIDNDGYLDVVVSRNNRDNLGECVVYAWTYDRMADTLRKLGDPIRLPNSAHTAEGDHGPSIPFVGDIDGDGWADIAFSTQYRLHAYRYKKGTNKLEKLNDNWPLGTSDESASTTLTLFDFDQDGAMELVYRDVTTLRIINSTATAKNTIPCYSLTLNEYPVVADVTGNGRANIVVFGRPEATPETNRGNLFIFDSDPNGQWAPARKVWNQWAYNVVNVDNDLTIPQFQMNPGTVFEDGKCGSPKRPYNGFLMQQTMLDQHGCGYWTAANIKWVVEPTAAVSGTSATFTGTITNAGEANLEKPIYVTFYRNDTIVPPGSIIKLDSITAPIPIGGTYTFTFTLDRLDTLQPLLKLFISINDKNGDYPNQQQCLVDGRRFALMVPVFEQAGTMTACVTAVVSKEFEVFTPDVLSLLDCAIGNVSVNSVSSIRPADMTFTNDKKLSYKPLVTVSGTYKDTVTIHAVDTKNNQAFVVHLEVGVTLTDPPAPALTQRDTTFCSDDNKTVGDLSTAGGAGVKWYNEFDELLPAGEKLQTGTYYASQTVDGCESAARTEVTVTVNPCAFEIIIPDDCATNPRLQVRPQYPGATCEWYRDGVLIAGAGSAEYKLNETADLGTHKYKVKVTYLGATRDTQEVEITIESKTMQGGVVWYNVAMN